MTTSSFHVLIVEDDGVTRAKLAGYLEAAGYRVSEAAEGSVMRRVMRDDPADLLLLDINLPGEDGLELTREVRARSEIGIILVSGRTDDVDRIVGLEMVADDYVTKPFNPRELLARTKNLLRRTAGAARAETPMRNFAGFHFDLRTRRLTDPAGTRIPLTRAEFELLSAFTARPGEVLTRDRLLDCITHRTWDPNDRTVDVLVRRLRRKIETDPRAPRNLQTVRGQGYILRPDGG